MIIVRSPLRITLGGGGTDLPSYYGNYGGYMVSAAIDKYVYVTIMRPFTPGIFLKYSEIEKVDSVDEVRHPIIRETLKLANVTEPQIEITTLADIPAGTGLGSSGSFTTALVKGLYAHQRRHISPVELAEAACDIEINKLGRPIGKQDQYIAAHGGITGMKFHTTGQVDTAQLDISTETLFDLEDNLLLFFTGFSRSAADLLSDQDKKTKESDGEMINNLHYIKDLGIRSRDALLAGDTTLFGELMHEHWEHKKRRSKNMSNPHVDEWYDLAMKNGAVGGKLVGAGGGGFLMFYARDRNPLRHAMFRAGLQEVRFRFDFEGTKVTAS